jgi:hypothetical protein
MLVARIRADPPLVRPTDDRGDVEGPVAKAPTPAVGARWTVPRCREGYRSPLIWDE